MAITAGKLNKRVSILALSGERDEFGQPVNTPTELAKVWALIEDLTGREFIAAQATQNRIESKIWLRSRTDIKPSMRVQHGLDIYNIEAVLQRGPEWLLLMCSRVV